MIACGAHWCMGKQCHKICQRPRTQKKKKKRRLPIALSATHFPRTALSEEGDIPPVCALTTKRGLLAAEADPPLGVAPPRVAVDDKPLGGRQGGRAEARRRRGIEGDWVKGKAGGV